MFKNPAFASLFLLIFTLLWVFLCGVLSLQAGWYRFARKHPFTTLYTKPYENFPYSSLLLGYTGSYSYSMHISLHNEGIGITPHLLFKAFHKPIFIRWKEITALKEGKEFFWYPVLDLYVDHVKVRIYGKPIEKIKAAIAEHKSQTGD